MRRSRVLVVAAGLLVAFAALWLRAGWLQLALHGHYSARAERNQEHRVLIKPARGNLLDRHGRLLARDLQTYSVAAVPREMQDPAGTARRLARVLKLNPRELERKFRQRPAYVALARRVTPEVAERIEAIEGRGLYLTRETQREYLLGDAAAELIGCTDVDNRGVEGLELQLDEDLRGRAGWATVFKDGRGRPMTLPRGLRRSPTDGHSVVLSIDADLQSILETHLARAVDTLNAKQGFGVFVDPRTGEVLASVSVPHAGPGRGRNWSFIDQYEPGSTFKIVVAGAALEEGVVRPDQWFEASETGVAKVAPGAIFTDVHREAGYSFRDAVRWSSNIVMGKVAMLLGDEQMYRYATSMGFGSLTGIDFPGEAGGVLRSPARWSLRSSPTIAIGYEVSVTALQLALAYGAVANGGVLMTPQLVREVRDVEGRTVRRLTPRASHRVLGERTAQTLGEMLTAVVDSGTAKAARVPGLRIAGKTGTARKYDAEGGGYRERKYHASFAGFAPADEPVLAGVIVIDEPRGRHYYGGDVAAPIFREVLMDLCRLPGGPLATDPSRVAVRPPAPAPVTVPDVRRMRAGGARRELARAGLRVRFVGEGPRALAQAPAAGQAVERGAGITVFLAAPDDSISRTMPDLAGLTIREALRRLSAVGIVPEIRGSGVVARQQPQPGEPLQPGTPCRLWFRRGVSDVAAGDGAFALPAASGGADRP
jgi:stage V sporulation protein D (sporulation-specific penicillin-binding protein)